MTKMDNSDSSAALDIKNILELYKRGVNITSYLKGVLGKNHNNEEIIEMAYEAQAGSYLNLLVNGDSSEFFSACKEKAEILDSIIKPFNVVLDCGVGECTTLAGVFSALDKKVKLFGFDISLSRILMGKKPWNYLVAAFLWIYLLPNWVRYHFKIIQSIL
jgi:hypothetical protein